MTTDRTGRFALTLYGEALCPDTAAYVTRVLAPLLDSGLLGVGAGGAGGDARGDIDGRLAQGKNG